MMNQFDDIQVSTNQFIPRQETLLESGEKQVQTSYWQQKPDDEPSVFELLPKLHQSNPPCKERTAIKIELPENLSNWIHDFSKKQSLQPSVIFLAIYKLLLHKYSNLDDIIVGIAVDPCVLDIFAIRTKFEEHIKFNEFLQNVNRNVVSSMDHVDRHLLEDIAFQITYTYWNNTKRNDLTKEIYWTEDSDISLEIIENQSSFNLNFTLNTQAYPSKVIDRFSDSYTVLLTEISNDPDRQVQAYPIIAELEKQQLLIDFNDTQFDYPSNKCIHQLFAEKVIAKPDKIAVVFENKQLSYQQLYDQCCDLALFLQSLGITPDSLVGLCLERSIEMMVGIQGIFMAGGAYVPMDPDYPDNRLAYMLEDSQPLIVLCQGRLKKRLSSLVSKKTTLIALDESWNEIITHVGELKRQKINLRREVQSCHLAYVIYTSGSTGVPKGVMVEHQALMNRIDWMQRMYPLNEDDVVLQKTPFSFDVSVWEFVWPMMAGASIVFAKPGGHKEVSYLENLIRQSNVTTLHFVPSMLQTYTGYTQNHCDSVRQLFCSGEALDNKSVIACKTRFPKARLHNLYGPTEAAIDVTYFDCAHLSTAFVPIGAPISNTQIYIVDKYYNPQPIGVAGELHIAGDGLARGYLNRRELTNEKFVINPFNSGSRLYKTGDWARWMEDGNIEFLGRIDSQVKIRGFRIETGEIETRLNQHRGIVSSHVVVQGMDAEKRLIAFYQSKETKAGRIVKLPTENLRSHLMQTLPNYMLPTAFVSVEAFPTTSNGKLNRQALADMDVKFESNYAYLAPRNETERQLVLIWTEVLNIPPEKISINDSFFELGGHSLLIAQLISKIRNQLEADLPLNVFFDQYTIAGIAEVIEAGNNDDKDQLGNVESDEITI